ncbi:hypothetical protein AAVH_18831 [Aphelenchoides avenae]|nr:hypothetical protein AAVH_18831 [Aphelenchus avenae]
MFLFTVILLMSAACQAAKSDEGTCRLASNNAGDLPSQVKDGKEFTAAHLRFRCSGGVATAFGCQLDNEGGGKKLKAGDEVVKGRSTYSCTEKDGVFEYSVHRKPLPPNDPLGSSETCRARTASKSTAKFTKARTQDLGLECEAIA